MKSTPLFGRTFILALALLCILFCLAALPSRAQNVEDAPLSDEAPAAAPPHSSRPQPEAPLAATFDDSGVAPGDIEPQQGIFDFATTFRKDFIRQALWAGLLVALGCAYLGVYVVLKRIVFVGVALAEVSSAGIALALLLGFAPILGATLFMLLGVGLFSIRWSPRRVPGESYIGIMYSIAAAIGILLIAKSAQGESHMLKLLQGDVLTVTAGETWMLFGAFALLGLVHVLFAKEFTLVSFDREAAATLGFRAGAWDFLLFLTIGSAIAFSIHSTGVLLTSTMLILPAATALLLANSMRRAFLLAPLLAIVPVALGLHISLVADLPASAVIVALAFAGFLIALGISKLRGK